MPIYYILLTFLIPILLYIGIYISGSNIYPNKLGINNMEYENKSQYECGIELQEEKKDIKKEKYYIKFYLVTILFLIFDLESILLYPISLVYHIFDPIQEFFSYIILNIFIYLLLFGIYLEATKSIF